MHELNYYSTHYEEARTRFLQIARHKGAELHALPVDEEEALFIDIALWRGREDTLILHTSGLHGVEAFPGAAVQCAFVDALETERLEGKTLVIIHCVNPYGMQYVRRWNAQNIDLNRNFIDLLDTLPKNAMYEKVSAVLNPQHSHQLKGFYGKAFWLLLQHGFSALQQAIAQGQYFFPEGIFYGGATPSAEVKLMLDFFKNHLASYKNVVGIDFHTGLGKYQQSSYFLESDFNSRERKYIESILQEAVIHVEAGKKQTYKTQGGFIARLKRLYNDKNFVMVTQEIGTVGPVKIIKALREENFYEQHAPALRQDAAHRLKAAFCPEDERWKATAVQEGVKALSRLAEYSFQ